MLLIGRVGRVANHQLVGVSRHEPANDAGIRPDFGDIIVKNGVCLSVADADRQIRDKVHGKGYAFAATIVALLSETVEHLLYETDSSGNVVERDAA